MIAIDRWYCALLFLLALQIFTSILRYYVRVFIIKRIGIDDVASFITLLISVTFCSLLARILITSHGADGFSLPWNVFISDANLALGNILLYGLGTMSLKITVGLFLLRIFITRWHVLAIYIVMSVSIIYGIFFFFFNLFQCGNPRDFAINVIEAKCFSKETVNGVAYTHAVLCAVADVIFGILPIFYLRTANLDRRTKMSVGGILCLGSAGCICTLIRIGWIHYLTTPAEDFFRTTGGISVMSAAELSIGLTCLALTTYKPLFKHGFFHRRQSHIGQELIPRDRIASIRDVEEGQGSELKDIQDFEFSATTTFSNSSGQKKSTEILSAREILSTMSSSDEGVDVESMRPLPRE